MPWHSRQRTEQLSGKDPQCERAEKQEDCHEGKIEEAKESEEDRGHSHPQARQSEAHQEPIQHHISFERHNNESTKSEGYLAFRGNHVQSAVEEDRSVWTLLTTCTVTDKSHDSVQHSESGHCIERTQWKRGEHEHNLEGKYLQRCEHPSRARGQSSSGKSKEGSIPTNQQRNGCSRRPHNNKEDIWTNCSDPELQTDNIDIKIRKNGKIYRQARDNLTGTLMGLK